LIHLDYLDLKGTQVTNAGMQELQKHLPELKITK